MIQQGLKPGTSLKGATYRIEKMLGQGSFGITYLATAKVTTHGNLGKMDIEARVAIKEFFMSDVNGRKEDGSTVEGSSGSVFSNYRKKFRNEAVNLSKLSHPNIVKVLDVFDQNNTTYYVMEFLDGTNLDEYIRQCGSIREHEAIQIISEIGHALSYMHSQKMLHLDIKPKNIMRKSDGRTCLIDFGLAKQFNEDGEPESSTSIGLGTPGYAPIEQSGYKQDGTFPATLDVYALGATMFKMLTGKRPPDATNILNEGFPDTELSTSGVSDSTAAAVEKAMEPMKKNRYQNIGEFLSGFETTEIEDVTIIEAPVKPKPKPVIKPIPKPAPKPIADTNLNPKPTPSYKWVWFVVPVFIIAATVLSLNLFKTGDTSGSLQGIPDTTMVIPQVNDELVPADEDLSDVYDTQIHHSHEYVDLGLPSGLKWATCNVGASTPSDYGNYYAWGETATKSNYTSETSKTYGKSESELKSAGIINSSGNLTMSYDAARSNWGGNWRMPTKKECEELVDKCKWTWTSQGGHNGYRITGPNGKSIFLPAAGFRFGTSLSNAGEDGYYWSSTCFDDTFNAFFLFFNSSLRYVDWYYRFYGRSVRAVAE